MGPAPSKNRWRLYQDLSWTWPIISPPSHYASEARQFWKFLRTAAANHVIDVLHLGCGGGHLDSQLKRHARITGVDLSPSMLRLARKLNHGIQYVRGDMRSVRLDRVFDGVLISDAVAYLRTPEDLTRAFGTAYRHLRPGGSVVTYAEHTRETFKQNRTDTRLARQGNVELAFIENRYDPDPRDTTFEATFVYLIRRAHRLRIETDRHVLGLFPVATWRRCLREAGFQVRHAGPDPAYRRDRMPWFAGRKPL